jgi:hypothetical protein
VVFTRGELDKPLSFFAYLVGDRPGAYAERSLQVSVGGAPVDVTIRAWPDDEVWLNRVSDLVERALPELARQIGMDWRLDGPLVVQEAASRSTGGYAGLFDPAERRVEVAYYADDDVVLHELAHAWFNGSLLADRWANEGFASAYAAETMASLGLPSTVDELTEGMIDARIPLNAWGPIGREETATEDYAYLTSLDVAQAAVGLAGSAVMPGVWADAAGRIGAYQPPAGSLEPELVDGPPDWRGLLDLLEARSGQSFADEWRRCVVRDTDLPLLDARRDARARYGEILDAAGDWHLPRTIRDAMRAWQFDVATQLLDDADRILAQRTEIGDAAAASGLTPPASLEAAFELRDGFATASAEATAELEAIARYDAAVATRPASPTSSRCLACGARRPKPTWPALVISSPPATSPRRPAAGPLPRSGSAPRTSARTAGQPGSACARPVPGDRPVRRLVARPTSPPAPIRRPPDRRRPVRYTRRHPEPATPVSASGGTRGVDPD